MSQSSCSSPHKAFFVPSPDLRSLLLLIHEFAVANSTCKDGAELTICYSDPNSALEHQEPVVVVANKCKEDGTHFFSFNEVISCAYEQRCLDIVLRDSSALISAFRSWIHALRSLTGRGDTEIRFLYRWKPSSSRDEDGDWTPWTNPCSWTTQLLLGLDGSKTPPSWTVVKDVEDFDLDED